MVAVNASSFHDIHGSSYSKTSPGQSAWQRGQSSLEWQGRGSVLVTFGLPKALVTGSSANGSLPAYWALADGPSSTDG